MFTTMCPKEQQTSDNLIVKDYCFIIEIFDKFSFSDIVGGCFPLTVPPPLQSGGKIFLYSHLGLTVFTTMCPKEQQTSDNLIVKDYCFIIEIFDKFSFSDILRGCLRHLIEAWKK